MDALISKQAAIDALGEEPEVWSGNDEYAQGRNNQWHYDVNALKALTPAQSKSKTEKWYIDEEGDVRCPACKTKCLRDDIGINILSNFCPNCGAKMWVAERDACDGCKTCEFFLHEYWSCQGDQEICPEYLANFIQTEEGE